MCGIIGQVHSEGQIDPVLFDTMRDMLTHRGPDGAGTNVLEEGQVALGHRRLSIIDLSDQGRQPMANEDEQVWLTFNGEIYNFQGLKDELLAKGHLFRSDTDSEVLIHGYEEWGIEGLLSRIKGMFAFALWDGRTKRLVAARDRFGIKPFYYYHHQGKLIFASEIKAITRNPEVERSVDQNSLADFFLYSYVPCPRTIWQHVHKLPPAHYMVYDAKQNRLQTERYWELKHADNVMSDKDALQRATELLEQATRQHLISDVPVGLFLSGGYDSTALLMHMRDLNYDVSSYSIGFENSSKSEHEPARKIGGIFGSHHNEWVLGDDLDTRAIVEKLAYYFDDPYAFSSMIPYYLVSELAAKHTKVVMAGDGGDEAFAGYKWHYAIRDYFQKPTLRQQLNIRLKGKKKVIMQQYDRYMKGVVDELQKRQVLNGDLWSLIKQRGLWLYDQHYTGLESPVKEFQSLDQQLYIPEASLTRADRSSMAHSLEVRVPFLDHEIFEFLFSLDVNVYMKDGVKKFLIHEQLKNRVTPDILNLPKRGFSFQHLNKVFDKAFEERLEGGHLMKHGILKTGTQVGKLPKSLKYHLFILELWFDYHYSL